MGALLFEFLELYGRDFNYATVGVSVRHNGAYFPKAQRHWAYPHRPSLLAMENPDDASLDVGKNSFAMPRVRRAFDHAHGRVRAACAGDWRRACLLQAVIDTTCLNPRVDGDAEA